jgi:uncharacterized protein (DUF58 family)
VSQLPFLILLLVLVAILLRLDFIFYIVYVCFGIFTLSHWWTNRGLMGLQVRRRFADHAFLDEQVTVEIELRNRARLPLPWVQATEVVPILLHQPSSVREVMSLGARSRGAVRYTLDCRRRGYYRLGPLFLGAGDLFGFADAERRDIANDYVTVYPQIVPLTRLGLPSKSPFGTIKTPQQIYEDPARTVGVRDYQPGDSLRRVHWKASARQDRLLVRKYEPAISLETMLLLNLNLEEYDYPTRAGMSEWGIVVAASVASHLVSERQAVGLQTNGRDPLAEDQKPLRLTPRTGRAHLMKVLETLARVEAHETAPLAQWLRTAAHGLPWGVTLVVITPNGDEATCAALHALVRTGYNVVLLICEPQVQIAQVRSRARRLGFKAFPVWDEKGLRARTQSAA